MNSVPEPTLRGLHHLTLTVVDLDTSIDWYCRVLGYAEVLRAEGVDMRRALLRRDDSISISFVDHRDAAVAGRFDEHRVGLDHVGFAVADRTELERWIEVLDRYGVPHSPITPGVMGAAVSFRDPDNIALELYTLG